MQSLTDKVLMIEKLYKGNRGPNGSREGFGWQLFLNGFMYIGNWKNNIASGQGAFIHNNGTILKGNFEQYNFREGEVRYYNGARFEGSLDRINENFEKGVFYCQNGHKLDVVWRNGKILKGKVELAPNSSAMYPQTFNFDFSTTLPNERWIADGKTIMVEGEKGLIIKFNGTSIFEGTINRGQRTGIGYKYYSPNKYYEKWFNNNIFEGEGRIVDIEEYRQQKIKKTNYKSEIVEKMFFSGFLVQKQSQNVYKILIKYIENDYIKPDGDLNPDVLMCSELILPSGVYHYTLDNRNLHGIKFKNMKRMELFSMVVDKRIQFDIVSKSIFNENPKMKNLVDEIFGTIFIKHKSLYTNEHESSKKDVDPMMNDSINPLEKSDFLGLNNNSLNLEELLPKNHPSSPHRAIDNLCPEIGFDLDSTIKVERGSALKLSGDKKMLTEVVSIESSRNNITNDGNGTYGSKVRNQNIKNAQQSDKSDTEYKLPYQQSTDIAIKIHENGHAQNGSKGKERIIIQGNQYAQPQIFHKEAGIDVSTWTGPKQKNLELYAVVSILIPKISTSKQSESFPILFHAKELDKEPEAVQKEIGQNIQVQGNSNESTLTFFKGVLHNGKYDGLCELEFSDGVKIKTVFVEGKKNGYYFKENNGVVLEGEYSNDKPVGTFKQIENGQSKLGVMRNGVFYARVTRKLKNLTVEVEDGSDETLNGRALLKLGDYDLECSFDNNEIVKKQKNCLLQKRGIEDILIGKFDVDVGGSKGVFRSKQMEFFLIDMQKQIVLPFGGLD